MFTDNDLEYVIEVWPHVEAFHLFYHGVEHPAVHLTLRGVTALLYHCPKLTYFTLMFNSMEPMFLGISLDLAFRRCAIPGDYWCRRKGGLRA